MLKDLHIAHLTGTATVHKNGLFSDTIQFNRPRRSLGQMFFKPYESGKEFIFCARNTLQPLLLLGIGLLDPMSVVMMPVTFTVASVGLLLVGSVSKFVNNEAVASWCFDAADGLFTALCQTLINLIVLPIALLASVTRGISTGLKATGAYDYDASRDGAPQALSA